jgi:hypothetical protein
MTLLPYKDTPQGRPPSIKNPGERLASHPRLDVIVAVIVKAHCFAFE